MSVVLKEQRAGHSIRTGLALLLSLRNRLAPSFQGGGTEGPPWKPQLNPPLEASMEDSEGTSAGGHGYFTTTTTTTTGYCLYPERKTLRFS